MQYIYHSPYRPLSIGFYLALCQPYVVHKYHSPQRIENAFKVCTPIHRDLADRLELYVLNHDGSPDNEWLHKDYERFLKEKEQNESPS